MSGSSVVSSQKITVPDNNGDDICTIFAYIDATNVISESVETNNDAYWSSLTEFHAVDDGPSATPGPGGVPSSTTGATDTGWIAATYPNSLAELVLFETRLTADGIIGDVQVVDFEQDNGWGHGNFAGTTTDYDESLIPADDSSHTYSAYVSDPFNNSGFGSSGDATGSILWNGSHADIGSIDVKFDLVNTNGSSAGADNPGIGKIDTSNDVDRGFSTTETATQFESGQWLELDATEQPGLEGSLVVTFEFPVKAVGFYLMGREDSKDDVTMTFTMADGSTQVPVSADPIVPTGDDTTTGSSLDNGSVQFYGFVSPDAADAACLIQTITINQPHVSARDIISMDDLRFVAADKTTFAAYQIDLAGSSTHDSSSTDPHSTDPSSTDPHSTDPSSTDPHSTDPSSNDHVMGSMIGQARGDTVMYDGDFDRYTVTSYKGDDSADTSSALYTILTDSFSDVDISAWTEDDTVVVVQDTNAGAKSFGTDVLINAERIQFDDQEYLLSVQTDVNSWTEDRYDPNSGQWVSTTMGDANWQGTFSADTINSSSIVVAEGSTAPDTDRMDGQAGDDILISGAGGDRLIGGIGDDILDGGANGTTGDSWRDSDVAEYSGSIDRFTLEKVIFEGKNLNISDEQGNGVFVLKAVTKGDNIIGQISKVGSTEVLYQVDKGETFIVVKDSLPLAYGGVGTDILLGMEKAQFGFDWEGQVDFQVNYEVHSWGGSDGEVRGVGTIFNDVIDLRAGKASDNTGGYGGFDDFNDGADIWDGDAFFTGADATQGV